MKNVLGDRKAKSQKSEQKETAAIPWTSKKRTSAGRTLEGPEAKETSGTGKELRQWGKKGIFRTSRRWPSATQVGGLNKKLRNPIIFFLGQK